MNKFIELYRADIDRYANGNAPKWNRKFSYFHRKAQTCQNPVLKMYYRYRWNIIQRKNGLEIFCDTSIGPGFYLGHPYSITVNPKTIIGANCNIHKGVTLGQENRGKRKGTPIIGNNVWIGINATIVGNVRIGNDVMIAPGAFVNFDVPDHSVVFGNPGIIKHKDNATESYINNAADIL